MVIEQETVQITLWGKHFLCFFYVSEYSASLTTLKKTGFTPRPLFLDAFLNIKTCQIYILTLQLTFFTHFDTVKVTMSVYGDKLVQALYNHMDVGSEGISDVALVAG